MFPRGSVTGNIIYNGKTQEVKGMAYHDHQFHNTDSMTTIHHWLWGRQSLESYTVVIFDIVANEKYGFKQIPIFGLINNKTGDVIFKNTKNAKCEINELYLQEESQKLHPKVVKFTYEHNGMKVEYTIKYKEEIEVRTSKDIFGKEDEEVKEKLAKLGLDPSYIRYYADAELVVTQGNEVKKEAGDMIYEYAYFGKPDERANIKVNS